jgi:hypothetical protein
VKSVRLLLAGAAVGVTTTLLVVVGIASYALRNDELQAKRMLHDCLEDWRLGLPVRGLQDSDHDKGAVLLSFEIGPLKKGLSSDVYFIQANLYFESRASSKLVCSKKFSVVRDGNSYLISGERLASSL